MTSHIHTRLKKSPLVRPSREPRPIAAKALPTDSRQLIGNLGVQNVLGSATLSSVSEMTRPNDSQEREADRIADQVVGGNSTGFVADSPLTSLYSGRQLEGGKGTLYRKAAGSEARTPSSVNGLGQGRKLPERNRQFFESRMGMDFSDVNIYTDNQSAQLSQSLGARAFTYGNHIAFAPDEFAPDSGAGQRLLAHELAHVAQQRSNNKAIIARFPSFTGCDPQTTGDGDSLQLVQRGWQLALAWVDDAIRQIQFLDDQTYDPEHWWDNVDDIQARLNYHFHCPGPGHLRQILENFRYIRNGIDNTLVTCLSHCEPYQHRIEHDERGVFLCPWHFPSNLAPARQTDNAGEPVERSGASVEFIAHHIIAAEAVTQVRLSAGDINQFGGFHQGQFEYGGEPGRRDPEYANPPGGALQMMGNYKSYINFALNNPAESNVCQSPQQEPQQPREVTPQTGHRPHQTVYIYSDQQGRMTWSYVSAVGVRSRPYDSFYDGNSHYILMGGERFDLTSDRQVVRHTTQ